MHTTWRHDQKSTIIIKSTKPHKIESSIARRLVDPPRRRAVHSNT